MIQLKPFTYNDFHCPECGVGRILNHDIRIEGLHAIADNTCRDCGFEFSELLPVGHTLDYRISFGRINLRLYNTSDAWVTKGLTKYIQPPRGDKVEIRRTVSKHCKDVILLNALDFLYGHSLLKLLNCDHHLSADPQRGLVVLVPSNFEWLVPKACAEVWAVDMPLSKFHYRYQAIDAFVKAQLERFDSVLLSPAYPHPDCSEIDISRFTGVIPFALELFNVKPIQITFVLREDRWWVPHPLFNPLFQFLRKMGLKKAGVRLLASQQNALVEGTVRRLRKYFPSARFVTVGLGKTGRIESVTDRRVARMTEQTEREWCEVYADSQIVVGVHGSNMILPTAHAGGCIEILPEDRFANIVQDIAVRMRDRRQLFLYRFVNEFARPHTVVAHAVSVLKGYKVFNRTMGARQNTVQQLHDNDRVLHDFYHGQG